MNLTPEIIKELREKSGAGMMDCKKALDESDGNVEKAIEWLGWINDIDNILLETDILCLPSYREGLPKSLVEGAAAGLPLVATDTVGCREVVVEGHNGFLVPIKDSEKLAAAIEKLIVDSSLRKLMGRESFKMAISKFSSSKINSLTLKVYNEC